MRLVWILGVNTVFRRRVGLRALGFGSWALLCARLEMGSGFVTAVAGWPACWLQILECCLGHLSDLGIHRKGKEHDKKKGKKENNKIETDCKDPFHPRADPREASQPAS